MDERDRLLLMLLRRDARRSIVDLARAINLSRSATQERLARLQTTGAIRGFTIVERSEGGDSQSAYLTLGFHPSYRCAQIVPKLKDIPGVALIHSVTGETDVIIRVDGQSIADIERCRSAIAAVPGIATVATSVVLDKHLG
ncbi:MAG: Lrp/AsnC family transcriptional regulator [Sphingomonas sp.]|uniref:Lrp/AsnC family transcriptional regulator n=1 Tax=Sphingomonas sp. TaxID=28214 RepID=UPI00182F8C20|nr:Lrp/AsnC family transcriptional regulator [Sphingomonas sp.]MBA3667027.1 Lrp/AsnC family transcriptional regulator [Sphingomonas sp.]